MYNWYCTYFRFREGLLNGGYLRHTELISQNKNSVVLSAPQLNSNAAPPSPNLVASQPGDIIPPQIAGEVKIAVLRIPGFQYLEW